MSTIKIVLKTVTGKVQYGAGSVCPAVIKEDRHVCKSAQCENNAVNTVNK